MKAGEIGALYDHAGALGDRVLTAGEGAHIADSAFKSFMCIVAYKWTSCLPLKAEIYFYDSVTPRSRSCLDGLVFIYGSPTVVSYCELL